LESPESLIKAGFVAGSSVEGWRNVLTEEDEVTLQDVKVILDAEMIVGEDQLGKEVKTAFSADLMSDVLAFATAGSLLLTGVTNPQVVRTSEILDIAAIIMVRGKRPSQETIQLAQELKIPILSTRYILFETSGRLHARGIVGCIEKVGDRTDAGRSKV
jgi:predicted transcriptional regulator